MAYNTIKVKKYSDNVEELIAAAAITPGMLVEVTSAGKVQAHSSAGQNALPKFALEDELQGKTINEDYSANDPVQVWTPYRGDLVYAILADGENASIGSELESNGDGTLRVHTADSAGAVEYPQSIVGIAREAVDLSGSSGEESSGPLGYDKRILVEII